MTVLDRMKDLLTRFENNDPALDSEILKIYSDVRFNRLKSIGYLANQRVTVLGNICENPELMKEAENDTEV